MKADGPILVGVDGSEQSRTAVSWAVAEAELRGAEVHLVVVEDRPAHDEDRWHMVRELGDHVRLEHPLVEIHERIVRGHPAQRLVSRSAKARMVVVGARGRGAITAALLGSVSVHLAMHAQCPVVVVRDLPDPSGQVAAGVDGSPQSRAALGFAFEAAALHHTDLVAIHVRQERSPEHAAPQPPPGAEQDRADGLEVALAEWDERYPNVPVHRVVPHGRPVAELVAAARGARLLVVGHRGRGGFAAVQLGSVASGVLQHAPCPVAVVRDETQ
ncbi:nucleotide-binding universal stress UspA family protein [Saccharopolyspora erythraea NRRL 2338]|uniref:Universal stress protein family n=2 Tax=Saccharopolyspora erythraea TaxID=1836 RepID=A4FCD2_SACEN|nr:universal stress protein [Saccharopolyspora erythraea]EQD84977.1 universal stress protein [Saccharopolyspora erythraea D]PFG95471.1 nucleotide-binding universal stress UspA family protein [Saccharopolyspora erythraea NRRL 2338]QRK92101.1 universal stress protein [Saccharopolyspora erythraea]CAM01707.1 universal stress protein family [Saccharopolyspora erythraea NRRL 2338]